MMSSAIRKVPRVTYEEALARVPEALKSGKLTRALGRLE